MINTNIYITVVKCKRVMPSLHGEKGLMRNGRIVLGKFRIFSQYVCRKKRKILEFFAKFLTKFRIVFASSGKINFREILQKSFQNTQEKLLNFSGRAPLSNIAFHKIYCKRQLEVYLWKDDKIFFQFSIFNINTMAAVILNILLINKEIGKKED